MKYASKFLNYFLFFVIAVLVYARVASERAISKYGGAPLRMFGAPPRMFGAPPPPAAPVKPLQPAGTAMAPIFGGMSQAQGAKMQYDGAKWAQSTGRPLYQKYLLSRNGT